MAEPDIAIDIVASASARSGAHDKHRHLFAPRPRLASLTLALIAQDATVTALMGFLCYAVVDPALPVTSSAAVIPMACLTVCLSLSFFERGLYAPPEIVNRELPWHKITLAWLQAVAIGTLATYCLAAVSGHENLVPSIDNTGASLRGIWLPVFLVLGFGALVGGRLIRLRFHGVAKPLNRTVIIGEQEPVHDLFSRITTGGRRTFDVIGIVHHTADRAANIDVPGLPLFGDLDALERMIRKDAVDTVLVALPWSAGEQLREIIQRISMAPVDVYIYPGMNGLDLPLRRAGRAFDLPLLMACSRPIGGWRAFIKRLEDVALSATLLAFISPVMLGIAMLIKLTSRGPVFFRQRRLGYNNRVIEVLKFRSMYTHLSDADATQQASRGDKRVTPFGTWLRRTSLDELPQLLNVPAGRHVVGRPAASRTCDHCRRLSLGRSCPDLCFTTSCKARNHRLGASQWLSWCAG